MPQANFSEPESYHQNETKSYKMQIIITKNCIIT